MLMNRERDEKIENLKQGIVRIEDSIVSLKRNKAAGGVRAKLTV